MKHIRIFLFALALITIFFVFQPFRAHGALALTVTHCNTPDELRDKIIQLQQAQGGSLNFNCGTKTITLSEQLTPIGYDTTIDGGNKITLDGASSTRIFQVVTDGKLTLKNIVLSRGYPAAGKGGAIHNLGQLELKHVTIQNSYSPFGGGALYTNGKLDIADSVLKNNIAAQGGAVYIDGGTSLATITNSAFNENQADMGNVGGAIYSAAAFNITNSTFTKNKAGGGGAIFARKTFLNTNASITGGAFNENETTAEDMTAKGGALLIENLPVTISHSHWQNNRAVLGGAIYVDTDGGLQLADSTLTSNSGRDGGALYNRGTAGLNQATLSNNEGLFGGAIDNWGILSLINATLSGNRGTYGDALMNDSGAATFVNVTVVTTESNTSNGGAIWNDAVYNPQLLLTNVVLSNSNDGIGLNCTFYTPPTLSASNLSNDNSCNFGAGRDNVDVKLGPLANNGGATQTHLPQAGSPALDGGTNVNAPNVDQRGVARPQGAAFDVGAVEKELTPPTPTRTATATRTATPTRTPTAMHSATPTRTATTTGCSAKPPKPVLVKPGNNNKVKKLRVTLDWNDAQCATSYMVMVKRDSPIGARVFKQKSLVLSRSKTTALTSGQTYYWRVIAKNSFGKTKSGWRSFTVK